VVKVSETGTWLLQLRPLFRLGFAFLSGALLALALAPFAFWWAILFITPVAALVTATPMARAAWWTGWWAGFGYFAVALHWIVEPFLVDAARHGWMALFALVLMAGGLALFWALAAWVSAKSMAPGAWRAVMFGAVLALSEFARGFIFTGFPWAQPGHLLISWDGAFPVLAATGGPLLMTLVVTMLGALGAVLIFRNARWPFAGFIALTLAAGFVQSAIPQPEVTMDADAPIIRLIQPNAPQHLKWQEDMIPVFFQRGLDLTSAPPAEGGAAPLLVLWPETSLPEILTFSETSRRAIADASGNAQVLVGAQRFEGVRPRNSAVLLGADGLIRAIYDKHHLVPFGEYLPLRGLAAQFGLRGLAETLNGGYAPGPGPQVIEMGEGLGSAFPMICYEAIFPHYIRNVERPDWMVHITNDAWFGKFSGPFQHLALARLRAAEQGLPVLRAANTGVSAVIDAQGRVLASLDLGQAGFLDHPLPPARSPTFYARNGDLPLLVLVFGLIALAGWRGRKTPALRPEK